MKNNFLYIFLLTFLILVNCSEKSTSKASYNKGEMIITTDENFKSVTEALAEGYMISYPETNIKVVTQKEDLGFLDLLDNKARIAVLSKELSADEVNAYEQKVDMKIVPARFAADAVVFFVPKNSQKTSITMEEISEGMQSDDKKFVFDGTNSSNLNFVAQKLNKKPKELKFSILPGSKNIIRELNKYPNKIGVIGLNTISRPYNKEAQNLRDSIKILPIISNGKSYSPDINGLQEMKYPFTRVLYFLTNEGNFNIANGFIRYSCTQLGQMVVDKEGLQPYNIYKREVQMR